MGTALVVVGEVGRDELEGSENEERDKQGNNKIIVHSILCGRFESQYISYKHFTVKKKKNGICDTAIGEEISR